jgi:hypothetical protein
MRLLSDARVCAWLSLFSIAGIGSLLYARNLNPVQWLFHADHEEVSPGSTVVLRLHAEIAGGYHLYSFTTPAGGPIKTTARLQASPGVKNLRVYQPKPDQLQDPVLKIPVETFQSNVDFLISGELPRKPASDDMLVTASIRLRRGFLSRAVIALSVVRRQWQPQNKIPADRGSTGISCSWRLQASDAGDCREPASWTLQEAGRARSIPAVR